MGTDLSEDIVLLTPDEINHFISTLRMRYGNVVPAKKKACQSDARLMQVCTGKEV